MTCPSAPSTTTFGMADVAPNFNYEWQVHVESRDEFWLLNNDNTQIFLRMDPTTGASVGSIVASSLNVYCALYDPLHDKVWAFGGYTSGTYAYDVTRIDVPTLAVDLEVALSPRGYPGYPLDICLDRNTGNPWFSSEELMYRLDAAGVQQETFTPTDAGMTTPRFWSPVMDADGTCWVITYDAGSPNSNIWKLVKLVPGAGTPADQYILDAPAVGRTIAYITYDSLHDAIWMAVRVSFDVDVGYTWELRRWNIGTSSIDLTIALTAHFYNTYIFDFDDVRNILWVNQPTTTAIVGYCGDTGALLHEADSTTLNLSDRSRLMFRRPGHHVYFDAYDDYHPDADFPGTGVYSWTELAPAPTVLGSRRQLGSDRSSNKLFVTGAGECYAVLSDGLYQVIGVDGSTLGWSMVKRADFTPGPNVQICDDLHATDLVLPTGYGRGEWLFIVSDGVGWTYDTVTKPDHVDLLPGLSQTRPVGDPGADYALKTAHIGDPIRPTACTFMDGYVVFALRNSNQFYWTNPYSPEIDALNFASAEANSDPVVGVLNNNEDLWVFGQKTVEIWFDQGATALSGVGSSTVFARKQGLLLETGCAGPNSICKVADNAIAWLALNERGGPTAVLTNGYAPVRISTFAIEQRWTALSADQLARATTFAYTQEGHTFVVFNAPGLSSTWVYDVTTSTQLGLPTWHERTWTDPQTGLQSRWRAEGHAYYMNRHLVTDYETGALFFLDQDGYTDNGDPITRQRVSPHIAASGRRMRYDALQLDVKTGVGDFVTTQPTLMLEYSNDGGQTWSETIAQPLGALGAYAGRVVFRQLGQSRDRVFRVTCTDAVDLAISGANLDLQVAAS